MTHELLRGDGMNRREFLACMGTAACVRAASQLDLEAFQESAAPDVTLRISPVSIEIAPGRIIKTTGYNGSAPGPVLRLPEGKLVTFDVHNDTDIPELAHWHGLFAPSDVDGSAEEGTPLVPPGGSRRYSFIARPAGTRWYHSHIHAGRNLKRATYTGQFGFLVVESKNDPGRYEQEVFVALHGWNPYLGVAGAGEGTLDAIYENFSMNSHSLGHGEPIRVREGQKVLFRILNANATLPHRLALPGHEFMVIALDGNPVPFPREVEVLEMGPAERVDAIVTMNNPGVWVLGDLEDNVRKAGLGVVVEYANQMGTASWSTPANSRWDYTFFGREANASVADAALVPIVFRKKFAGNRWVDNWTINGKSFPKTDPILVQANNRYRLRFDNQSDESHPVHLHRHSFELRNFAGKPTAGIVKDVVVVPAKSQVEVDLLADNPGPSLFHCHQQLHMDFGFMTLLQYRP
jgi:FtsP/CotA-like multicopper oxidase with cupredoxin domain